MPFWDRVSPLFNLFTPSLSHSLTLSLSLTHTSLLACSLTFVCPPAPGRTKSCARARRLSCALLRIQYDPGGADPDQPTQFNPPPARGLTFASSCRLAASLETSLPDYVALGTSLTMRWFHQSILLAFPLLAQVTTCEEDPTPPVKHPKSPTKDIRLLYSSPNEAFQELLNALPEESLHAALHSLTHFREGIFESDRRGVAHVHDENPPLATKLIVEAVKDLKKRQQPSNGTVTTSQPSEDPQSTNAASSDDAAPSSQSPPRSSAVLVPVVITTTDNQGRTSVASNEVLSEPTASVTVAVTRTDSQGQTTVATETKPAVVESTTDSSGRAQVTTRPVEYAPTISQVMTSTNDRGETFLTTYTPAGGRASSLLLVTTTGSDGNPTVMTSFTYVEPAKATSAAPTPSAGKGKPGLQDAGAMSRYGGASITVMVAAMAGAVAFLFV
ncbi:unnamed protein product [Periconia digitata]|uniref:Uncharacterized protein n=1 Tax=Periconia digitata TaxID=1303443 RepID=A0A9W4UV10_9PLEO|nr:unnamed protein product [Periconia digitata]